MHTRPTPLRAEASNSRRRWLLGCGLFGLQACGGGAGGAGAATSGASIVSADPLDAYPPMPAGPAPGASARARALAASLGRGINFGNMLEAPKEGDWGLRVEDDFIALVGATGLTNSVRLPVRWSNHANADAAALIEPAFLARVESVVDRLLARGVTVILNMHHYRQLDGDALDPGEAPVAAGVLKPRLLAMWQQIAERFAGRNERLLFEIYNEPHGTLNSGWNDLLSRALRVIRRSNPERVVVVGPTQWNSATALPQLVLPADANLVLTVHHYEPFKFTHQGAAWIQPTLPTGVDCCDASQLGVITGLLDQAQREATRLGYPCFVGEFGAYEAAAMPARERYARLLRNEMEKRGLPWFYWELASGFGVYDPARKAYRAGLKDALYGA